MSNMRTLLENISSFQHEKQIKEVDLSEELMNEFLSFLEANAAPTTATTTAAPGTQANASATASSLKTLNQPNQAVQAKPPTQPGQPVQPNQAAIGTQQVQDMTKALKDIKTASSNPNLDVNQALQALTTNKVTPQSTKALDALGTALAPALADKTAAGQIKSLVQRLQAP